MNTNIKEITLTQQVAFTILCSLEVYKEESYVKWANDWLENRDRSSDAAYTTAFAHASAIVANAASSGAIAAGAAAFYATNDSANTIAGTKFAITKALQAGLTIERLLELTDKAKEY